MPDRNAASPIRVGEAEWIVMGGAADRPAAVVKYFAPAGAPAYFRCVSWAPRSEDRRLIGRFATLAEAAQAVPSRDAGDPWERGQVPWDAAPRRTNRYERSGP